MRFKTGKICVTKAAVKSLLIAFILIAIFIYTRALIAIGSYLLSDVEYANVNDHIKIAEKTQTKSFDHLKEVR